MLQSSNGTLILTIPFKEPQILSWVQLVLPGFEFLAIFSITINISSSMLQYNKSDNMDHPAEACGAPLCGSSGRIAWSAVPCKRCCLLPVSKRQSVDCGKTKIIPSTAKSDAEQAEILESRALMDDTPSIWKVSGS